MRFRAVLRWTLRIAGGIVCLLAVALVVAAAYQAVAGNPDPGRYPPPGRLVDVGGRRLHILCAGEGSPTVILEAGLGLGMVTWRHIQPEVAKTTRVCSYDRAGYGWSDAGPLPRAATQVTGELHLLLAKAGISRPLVLVGHSLGGLFVRHYAAVYPRDVAGMVLVDSSHEEQGKPTALVVGAAKLLQGVGFRRVVFRFGDPALNAMYWSNKTNTATNDEFAAVPTSADEVRARRLSLGTTPLVVITAGNNDTGEWHRLQKDLLTRSSNSRRVVAERSGHIVQDDRPDLVIAAIREVVGSNHSTPSQAP
jgi:pimeloyl-ACP methyl ester carboxylesterase